MRFDNTFARLPPPFHEVIDPAPLPEPELIALNPDACHLLDLDPDSVDRATLTDWFAGNRRIPGAEPVAMLYAGHQFGVWVPQLGDGRAFLLGEVLNRRGERWDLHLKGGGPTRFARGGDGRAVLRSVIREYLACEAMAGLGISTSRALSIVGSSLKVRRETLERGAVLMRLAPTHVRFGSFEVFAARGRTDLVRRLADYVISLHFPEVDGKYGEWLRAVASRTGRLLADWQVYGFVHGVMNTDNMSMVGITLDYGPFAFLDQYDPTHIANHSDYQGRYAFNQQPAVGLWNLARLAEALSTLVSEQEAGDALTAYRETFESHAGRRFRSRLGLTTEEPGDTGLVAGFLDLLRSQHADYTRCFRALGSVTAAPGPCPALAACLREPGAMEPWLARYRARLAMQETDDRDRAARMSRVNPVYILRNWMAERAIRQAMGGEDYGEIERIHALLRDPFAEQCGMEEYAAAPPAWSRDLVISCSS